MPLIENPAKLGLHPHFAESGRQCAYNAALYGRVMNLMSAMTDDDCCTAQDVLFELSKIAQVLSDELKDTRTHVAEKPRAAVTALQGGDDTHHLDESVTA